MNTSQYDYPASSLSKYEQLVFKKEEDFIKRFAPKGTDTLYSIFFGSSRVKLYFILITGEHVTDSISVDDFLQWVDSL